MGPLVVCAKPPTQSQDPLRLHDDGIACWLDHIDSRSACPVAGHRGDRGRADNRLPVNPLATNPSESQARLLEVVYEGRHKAGGPRFQPIEQSHVPHEVGREADAWPIFQYVEKTLSRQHDLDARELIAEAPSIPLGTGSGRYGCLQLERPISALQAEDKVRLTIAGMAQVADAAAEVAAFIDMLTLLIEREQELAPHPTEVQTVEVWSGEIRKRLGQRWVIGDDDNLTAFTQLMSHEPLIWLCQVTPTEAGPWIVRPSPFLGRYAGVTNAAEYVDRLVEAIGLRVEPPAPLYPSSLSLPEAIDYLNAVWRLNLGNGEVLFRISRAEAAAKLALDCASVDELESRLSAFAGILSQIRLPGQDGDKKLVDLRGSWSSNSIVTLRIGRPSPSTISARLWRYASGGSTRARTRRHGPVRRDWGSHCRATTGARPGGGSEAAQWKPFR